ncbi:cell wall-binding repeat-containing protein [Ornithinimicrobium sp. W1679]|uniref:cell wall-binding repeat-containing protein n=1 Tax=Ornithinimicrobium sp. W1679 TaxID=3418770 RepID=UPI003CE7D51C
MRGSRVGVLLAALLVVLGLVVPGVLPPASAAGEGPSAEPTVETAAAGVAWSRIGGANRYAVAVNISRYRFADPSSVRSVYLARGDVFADALTAGSLGDGPVLLITNACRSVPAVVLDEIARLDPDRVVALGGEVSVCEEQLAQAAAGRPTARLGGADRFETAGTIARAAFPSRPATVYLANGSITPDAVVAGTLTDGPVLLTSRDGRSVPSATAAALARLNPSRVIALGGTLAVSDSTLTTAAAGRPTSRLGGSDRYATARLVADRAFPSRTSRVYLARGDGENFVDALSAGMLADGPVLLTSGPCDRLRSGPAAELAQRTPSRVVALGGLLALCDSTLVGSSTAARGQVDCARTACVALTFDDGPASGTSTVLDTFAQKRVPATFFVVGRKVASDGAITRRTWVEGHEVGNHTYDHPRLPDLTLSGQQAQVDRTDAALRAIGVPTTRTMRPPFLAFDANTRRLGKAVIMVDTNPKDWNGPSTQQIRTFIRDNVRPGSIVIQHDTVANTVAAMPGIVDDLHAMGYTLVTVPQLIPGLDPGDLVYNRTTVHGPGTAVSMLDPVELDDGRVLPPLVDEYGVPGLAPTLTREEVLGLDP